MLGLKLNHVSKRGHSALAMDLLRSCPKPLILAFLMVSYDMLDLIFQGYFIDTWQPYSLTANDKQLWRIGINQLLPSHNRTQWSMAMYAIPLFSMR